MRLGHADESTDPASSTTRRGYDLISQAFGKGYNSTLELVAQRADRHRPGLPRTRSRDQLTLQRRRRPQQRAPSPIGKNLAFVSSRRRRRRRTRRPRQLVKTLRRDLVPQLEQDVAEPGLRLRADRHAGRLREGARREDAAVLRRDHRAVVPAADARVPQPGDPADRRGDEPVRRRCIVRRRRRDLPVGLVLRRAGHRQRRADRRVPAGAVLRDPVRPVDGLPGVPGQPDARGVGAHRRQRARDPGRAGRDRRHHHRRGAAS